MCALGVTRATVTTSRLPWSLLTFIFTQSEAISHYFRTTITFLFHPETFKVPLQHLSENVRLLWAVMMITAAEYWLNVK